MKKSFLIIIALLLISGGSLALIPQTISLQGKITGERGPTVNVTFSIWDDATAGTMLWSDTKDVPIDPAGIFNTLLGDTPGRTFKDRGVDFSAPYWVEITIGSNPPITPRQPLNSVPYAFHAAVADNLARSNPTYWKAGANPDNVYNMNPGNVGIGADTPLSKLSISGGTAIGLNYAGVFTAPADGLLVEGNMGVGVSSPAGKLDVSATTTRPAILIANTGGGPALIAASGNVGIGTAAPLSKLSVGGTGVADTAIYGDGTATGILGRSENGIGVLGISRNSWSGHFEGSSYFGKMSAGDHTYPVNSLDVMGGVVIRGTGAASTAPTGGLLVQGDVGIGITAPAAKLDVVASSGNAVKASSAAYYGVWGVSTNNVGVYGSSTNNYGAEGISTNAIGVHGKGAQSGGIFESPSGPALIAAGKVGVNTFSPSAQLESRASMAGNAAILGSNEAAGAGVRGDSLQGTGVFGVAYAEGKSGVAGASLSSGTSTGNVGGSFAALGPYGRGVYGNGPGFGGYFESNSGNGTGVYGLGGTYGGNFVSNNGRGIYAGGATYGAWIQATAPSGIGIQSSATNTGGIAVKGDGYANGGRFTASSNGSTGVWAYGGGSGYNFYAANPAAASFGYASSVRWKENIKLIDNALDKVLSLRGVSFDWKKEQGGKHDMGMIAEEVGKVIPEIVVWEKDGSGYASGMDYGKLTPILVEAIKEQQKEINSLKEEVAKLKEKNSETK